MLKESAYGLSTFEIFINKDYKYVPCISDKFTIENLLKVKHIRTLEGVKLPEVKIE